MEEGPRRSWAAALGATRPTRPGARVLYGGGLFLAVAFATGKPSFYAGASLLLALYLVGHLGAAYAWRSLEIRWDCPSRVFAAAPFPVRLLVHNRGRAFLAGIEILREELSAEKWRTPARFAVRAGAAIPVEVRGLVRHRGRHRLAPPRIEVRWPFGLAVALWDTPGEREVLAYPRRVGVPSRAIRSRAPEVSRREVAAAVPRGGELLRGVRGWAPGDAPRAIAWRASARHGKLLTREFEREDAGSAIVALDADARDLPANDRTAAVERACSLAASLLLRLRAEGRRTALAAWTPEPVFLGSVAGERALGRALEALALLEPSPRSSPRRDPLALVPRGTLRGARVLLVKAGRGVERTTRGAGGTAVVTLPSLHAGYRPGPAR